MPCTSHPKKGWLPEFHGYIREREQELLQFSKDELKDLLRRKNMARFFSDDLRHLADPKYRYKPPPPPKAKSKKKQATAAAAQRPPSKKPPASPARPASQAPLSPEGERPASPTSPFHKRSSVRASPAVAASPSNHLHDFAAFFENSEDEDGA